jgi:hypothetical protein
MEKKERNNAHKAVFTGSDVKTCARKVHLHERVYADI